MYLLWPAGVKFDSCWIITLTKAYCNIPTKPLRILSEEVLKVKTVKQILQSLKKVQKRWWTPSWSSKLHGEKCAPEKMQVKHNYLCIVNW